MAYEMCGITMAAGPGGIARDATFGGIPIVYDSVTPASPATTSAFSVSASCKLIVVVVSWANFSGTAQHPVTVAWNGGAPANASTFAKQIEKAYTGSGANAGGVSIWTSSVTGSVSSKAIDITPATTDANDSASILVDALTGASTTMGLSDGAASASGSSVARSVTLGSVTAGSWLYVGATSETFPLSPVANTTEIDETAVTNGVVGAVGLNATGTSGSVTVGWSTSAAWSTAAALEIKAA
jgi:hypothetical protein